MARKLFKNMSRGGASEGACEKCRFLKRWTPAPSLSALLLFVLFTAAIIAATWPWARAFAEGVINHWDPPFHAWKLEYAARQMLAGRLLPPEGNTNMYYPHSGAFYYEALHWPQAAFAALLLAFDAAPLTAYHVTLVAFWALSGVCFWMMLRAFGLGAFGSAAGGLLFVLMPYRISYMPEFNMQLNFGLPLFFYFLIKFFKNLGAPGIAKQSLFALGMALSWWLQAVSELYQAVFVLFLLPFFACAMLSGRWRALRDWRGFWLPLAIAAAVGGGLSLAFLWPYFTTLQSNTLARSIREVSAHVLEPLSYLQPFNKRLLPGISVRHDEMSAYPTVSMLLLAVAGWAGWFRLKRRPARNVAPLAAALALFAAIAIGAYFIPSFSRLRAIYALLPAIATALLFPFVLRGGGGGGGGAGGSEAASGAGVERAFARGLFAAAVFSFFMSLGPGIISRKNGWQADNTLFLALYNHVTALHGFRVISRFSIFVMMFLVAGAALSLESFAKMRPGRRLFPRLALAVLAVLFAIEIKPTRKLTHIMPLKVPLQSEVLKNLDARAKPFVLAILPMGARRIDSQMMLQVASDKHLSVYAWGGTYPEYTRRVRDAFSPDETIPAQLGANLLRQLWPDALLLEDKSFSRAIPPKRNYAAKYSEEAHIVDEDERFVLMGLNADETPRPEWLKLIRRDYAAQNPIAEFTLAAPPPPTADASNVDMDTAAPPLKIWLDCNSVVLGSYAAAAPASDGGAAKFYAAIPPSIISARTPVRLRFHAENDAPFVLSSFALRAAAPDLSALCGGAIPPLQPSPPLPWLPIVDEVPPSAQKLHADYGDGLKIHGVEVLAADFTPGGAIRLRYYISPPKKITSLTKLAIKTSVTKNGASIFESDSSAIASHIDMNHFWGGGDRSKLYVCEQEFAAPGHCVAGEDYALAAIVRTSSGKRVSGKGADGKKNRRLHFSP